MELCELFPSEWLRNKAKEIPLTYIPQVKLRKPSIFPNNDFPENRVDTITSLSANFIYTS